MPYTTGRLPARQGGTLIPGNHRQGKSTSLSGSKDIPDERVYEGELLGKRFSFDPHSDDRANRLFTQQAGYSGFQSEDHPSSGRMDAIEIYTDYAGLTGADLPVFKNVLDVYA